MSGDLCTYCDNHATGTDATGAPSCARCAARLDADNERAGLGRPAHYAATVAALPFATRDAATCFIRCGEERAAGRCPAPDANGAERCARCPVQLAFPNLEPGDP
jgi:hypothetical protein